MLSIEEFASAFVSEADLRNRLRTLISRIDGNEGVQITHGTQELGKDIVFYAPDGLGQSVLHACVVKLGKISGAADDSRGARTVFNQVEQCLDSPYLKGTGEEQFVARVYVMSPHDCPPTTMSSILGKLRGRSGQVDFICGARLLDLFAKHWNEFLAFESSLFGHYAISLSKGLANSDPMAFLFAQHAISSQSKSLTEVYVRQCLQVVLQEFDLVVEPIRLNVSYSLRLHHISEMKEALEFMAQFVSHQQVWDEPSDCPPRLAAALREGGVLIERLWRAAWDQHRRESEEVGKHAVPISEANLSIALDDEQLKEAVALANKAVHDFSIAVHNANKLLKSLKKAEEYLGSDDYRNYCRVQEVARLMPQALKVTGKPRREFLSASVVETHTAPLLVTAPPGYGKTSFCKWNALNDLRHLAGSSTSTVPVYVPLHKLATEANGSPTEVFFGNADVRELVSGAAAQNRRVRLYLDGLDEITTTEQQERVMRLASELHAKRQDLQVIVTGRDYVSGPWLRWLSRVGLAELDNTQVDELISKWLGSDQHDTEEFKNQLALSKELSELMSVPLLGTLIIAVYKRVQSLPENRVRLYQMFVDLMCGGWDLAKNIPRKTSFGSVAKISVLTRLAGQMHISGTKESGESDFRVAVEKSLGELVKQWKELLDELLEDGLLLRGGKTLSFSHLSFQEYLAACDLLDPSGNRQLHALRCFLQGDNWWREVLSFYIESSARPDECEQWVLRTMSKLSAKMMPFDIQNRLDFLKRCISTKSKGWKPTNNKKWIIEGASEPVGD